MIQQCKNESILDINVDPCVPLPLAWNTYFPASNPQQTAQISINEKHKRIREVFSESHWPIVAFRWETDISPWLTLFLGVMNYHSFVSYAQTPFFQESDFISCGFSGSAVLFSLWITESIKTEATEAD